MDGVAVAIVVPVCVCVVLPIAIVWIVFATIRNKTNKQSEIILEALKNNPNVDPQGLLDALKQNPLTPLEKLNRKLLRGSIFTLIGISFAFFAGFCPEPEDAFGLWIICGISGAVGIGFLISYCFGYKHLDELRIEDKDCREK